MVTASIVNNRSKIALSISTGYIFLRPEEIISIQSDGSTTTANIVGTKQIKINSLLKHIEHDLPSCFFRSHKSHIINLNYMYQYNIREKFILMEDESIVPLSRRKVAEFNEFIKMNSFAHSN
ncbi:MAG: LytTR family transcriptional regulator [Marinilabiliaceae bacterium]|nr:LytTR family transcriptional regulator [Marinilabiliaceae bacterium]